MLSIDFDDFHNLSNSPLYTKASKISDKIEQIENEMMNEIPPYMSQYTGTLKDLIQNTTQKAVYSITNSTDGILNAVNCVITRLGYNHHDYYSYIQQVINSVISADFFDKPLQTLDNILQSMLGLWYRVDEVLYDLVLYIQPKYDKIKNLHSIVQKINGLYEKAMDIMGLVASISKCFPGKLDKKIDYSLEYINNMKYFINSTAGRIMDTTADLIEQNETIYVLDFKQVIDSELNLESHLNDSTSELQEILDELKNI